MKKLYCFYSFYEEEAGEEWEGKLDFFLLSIFADVPRTRLGGRRSLGIFRR
jgi:hypothetical protein